MIITTSWDDADPADLRVAEALAGRGLRGTFYLCRHFDGTPRLSAKEIRLLADMPGIEIGSHTLTHPDLRRVDPPRLQTEVAGSRNWLEDLIQRPVVSFCYPRGLYNPRVRRATAAAGYVMARTTGSSLTRIDSRRPYQVPTTLQMYPHTRMTQLRHALKEGDLAAARRIVSLHPWSRDVAQLCSTFIAASSSDPATVLHLWGHSWELRDNDWWAQLGRVLDRLCHVADATHLTNIEVLRIQ